MNRTRTVLTVVTLAVAIAVLIGGVVAIVEVQQWVPRPHVLSTMLVSAQCATPD